MQYQPMVGEWEDAPDSYSRMLPVDTEQYIKNVRDNCLLDLPNLDAQPEHDKIMVMVCGGPSAKLFLDEIREKSKDPRYTVMTSNNTHDWLIRNGIVPHYSFILDPKPSKVDDVRNPHRDVTYLISMSVVPEVFKMLHGYNVVRMFCVSGIGNPSDVDVIRAIFPYQKVTYIFGGTMAGLRAINISDALGYRKMEYYGFDSCYFDYDEQGVPIYYSYEKPRKENILEAQTSDGRLWLTSPVFASQARQFIKWRQLMEWMDITVHGESLTKALNDEYEAGMKPKHDLLITEYHREMNRQLLEKNPRMPDTQKFGMNGRAHAGRVALLAGNLAKKFGNITVLDYGAGGRTFEQSFPDIKGVTVTSYDPCVDEISAPPDAADLVVCTDVLEHVEQECLENVLNHLQRLTKKVLYVSVSLRKAYKSYSDGQNCHKIVMHEDRWLSKFRKRFYVGEVHEKQETLTCILQAKGGGNGHYQAN